MKVGDLVRVPAWQLNRIYWSEYRDCGMGFVFEVTPYAVHVRWSNGPSYRLQDKQSSVFGGGKVKAGDLVMWKWNGEVSSDTMGIIVSDYTESTAEDGSTYKNVYWFHKNWVRPIEQQYLEVISEGR